MIQNLEFARKPDIHIHVGVLDHDPKSTLLASTPSSYSKTCPPSEATHQWFLLVETRDAAFSVYCDLDPLPESAHSSYPQGTNL
jgi:hypothetical protein